MKIQNLIVKYTAIAMLCLTLISCEKDDFDGLLNTDPVPEAAITFPQSVGPNGIPLLDESAFIVYQDAIANGNISVDVRVPEGKQITAISVAAQRFRNGAATQPNLSPTLPTGTTNVDRVKRAPSVVITRNTAPNVAVNQAVTPGSTVTFTIPANAIPDVLSNTTIVQPDGTLAPGPPLGPLQVNDVIRMFFRVRIDGIEHRAMEVRVIVTG
ncbi:hypothetical protein [Pontibacter ramchanderi]|uniref:Uncharacterized protein n=1 Tax=Pontibacter ramchanderi TaxID=1179743 RepID=A0A2N3UAW3_9BACT|nr:hypothetical protein [Pontibacter ramchanderi]PKV66482.1 hypothetical protein BD749_1610 [Pontibacter ramchanderi]